MRGKQASGCVHDISFRQGSAQGGSWGQASVVSAPCVAACSRPSVRQSWELGGEARGWGCGAAQTAPRGFRPQRGPKVLSRAGTLRGGLGQDSYALQPPLNRVTSESPRASVSPRDNGDSSNISFAGRGTVQQHRGCSGPGLLSALPSSGLGLLPS